MTAHDHVVNLRVKADADNRIEGIKLDAPVPLFLDLIRDAFRRLVSKILLADVTRRNCLKRQCALGKNYRFSRSPSRRVAARRIVVPGRKEWQAVAD